MKVLKSIAYIMFYIFILCEGDMYSKNGIMYMVLNWNYNIFI